jgi:adenylate cyclase
LRHVHFCDGSGSHFENYRARFVVFGLVGGVAVALGYTAGEAANRRGDARVLLLSLAFMATGGFMGLHAFGTQNVLFTKEYAGFQVAIPVGLLVSAGFAGASAFVDIRPGLGAWVIRRRTLLRAAVLSTMAAWFVWTVAQLPRSAAQAAPSPVPVDDARAQSARQRSLRRPRRVHTILRAH